MHRAAALVILGVGFSSSRAAAQGLNAQSFHPTVDGFSFLRLHDSLVGLPGVGGGAVFNYASDPLVFRFDDPDVTEDAVLLSSVATLNMLGFYNAERYRIGLDIPMHLAAEGYQLDPQAEGYLLGDVALDAKVELIDRHSAPVGLAVTARASAPTGNDQAYLGAARPTVNTQVVAATGRDVITTVNVGLQTGRTELDDEFTVGSQVIGGAGVRLPLASQTWLTAETVGRYYFNASEPVEGFASEAIAALHVNPVDSVVFTMGGGIGLSQGVGAPDFRVMSGLVWSPQRATPATLMADGPDMDADGITDTRDRCPDQAEDYNGINDADGCPDGEWTPVTLFVVGPSGALVAGSHVELVRGPLTGEWVTNAGEITRALLPGDYRLRVWADGFEESIISLHVPGGAEFQQRLRINDLGERNGRVVVHVTDAEGQPLNASVRILGEDVAASRVSPDGVVERSLPPGAHEVVVAADGYRSERRMVTLQEDSESLIDLILIPTRVDVQSDAINLYERIYFEYDSATIRSDSYTLLDELASTLREYAHITLIEIQGHTDAQGAAEYNLELSQLRADAVRNYLVESGVSQARLVSRGYGESSPLRNEGHEANRRVEFHILKSR